MSSSCTCISLWGVDSSSGGAWDEDGISEGGFGGSGGGWDDDGISSTVAGGRCSLVGVAVYSGVDVEPCAWQAVVLHCSSTALSL